MTSTAYWVVYGVLKVFVLVGGEQFIAKMREANKNKSDKEIKEELEELAHRDGNNRPI